MPTLKDYLPTLEGSAPSVERVAAAAQAHAGTLTGGPVPLRGPAASVPRNSKPPFRRAAGRRRRLEPRRRPRVAPGRSRAIGAAPAG